MASARRSARDEAGKHPPPDLLEQVAATLRRLLDVDFTAIWGFDPIAQRLYLRTGDGWQPDYVGRTTVPLGAASPAGYAFVTGAPVVVADCASERRYGVPPLLGAHPALTGPLAPTPRPEGPPRPPGPYTNTRPHFAHAE